MNNDLRRIEKPVQMLSQIIHSMKGLFHFRLHLHPRFWDTLMSTRAKYDIDKVQRANAIYIGQ